MNTRAARSSRKARRRRKPALGLDPRVKEKRSYTGQFLKPVLARRIAPKRKAGVEAAESLTLIRWAGGPRDACCGAKLARAPPFCGLPNKARILD
jgi:hypothetical protein